LQAYHDAILVKKLASLQSPATERVKNLEGFEVKVPPDVVDSGRIGNELKLTISETKKILKTMHDMGVIESNMEAEYSLITRMGLNRLDS